ncbi:hypothetical protein ABL78_3465 [Leptomonas seymouri]|uniref:Uncharacterized protein n=1 Tax=Leptomonas seymouri TaxID=5684 RepID=A0A0N1I4Q7_LEPSE|nr:hypothetical protein ABL78_3465 [Leptomonas seymouri]|eukprot:KPI87434.1 hypothetical protein ABL78_3465 [Leptomonas seymouri]
MHTYSLMPNFRVKHGSHASAVSLTVVLVTLFVLVGLPVHAADDVSSTAWLSGNTALWSTVLEGDSKETIKPAVESAIRSDFTSAVSALDHDASLKKIALAINKESSSGLTYGVLVDFTFDTHLTPTEIDDCLRRSTMTNLNSLIISFMPSLPLKVTVLNTNKPSDMKHIVGSFLPLTGSTYMWKMMFKALNEGGLLEVAGLIVTFQQDLQDTLDSTAKLYVVVAPTNIDEHLVNASSLYMAYTVWSYPSNKSPDTADALEAKAMTTPLTQFNQLVNTLKTSYSALQSYTDLIVTPIKTWVPLVPDHHSGSSSGTVIEGSISGNYLLTFVGEANIWRGVLTKQRAVLYATIVATVEATLARRLFVTKAEVVSASVMAFGNSTVLRVVCYVSQSYSAGASHIWIPEEIASVLLLGDYAATQALYKAEAAIIADGGAVHFFQHSVVALASTSQAAGSLATTGVDYDYTLRLLSSEVGMIIMAAIIGFLILVAALILFALCCCCPNSIRLKKKELTPGLVASFAGSRQISRSQDASFDCNEHPRVALKVHNSPTGGE